MSGCSVRMRSRCACHSGAIAACANWRSSREDQSSRATRDGGASSSSSCSCGGVPAKRRHRLRAASQTSPCHCAGLAAARHHSDSMGRPLPGAGDEIGAFLVQRLEQLPPGWRGAEGLAQVQRGRDDEEFHAGFPTGAGMSGIVARSRLHGRFVAGLARFMRAKGLLSAVWESKWFVS